MKRVILISCVVLFIVGTTFFAFASGGKHHGDKGKGFVVQHQVRNVP